MAEAGELGREDRIRWGIAPWGCEQEWSRMTCALGLQLGGQAVIFWEDEGLLSIKFEEPKWRYEVGSRMDGRIRSLEVRVGALRLAVVQVWWVYVEKKRPGHSRKTDQADKEAQPRRPRGGSRWDRETCKPGGRCLGNYGMDNCACCWETKEVTFGQCGDIPGCSDFDQSHFIAVGWDGEAVAWVGGSLWWH